MAQIFISYRRSDSLAYAGRLFDRLRSRYGDAEVFMDLEGIEPGAEFGRVVEHQARAAEVLIALIGKDWAKLTTADGRRRLDDPDDLVVREIETGLNAKRRVMPVLAGKARMPAKDELPARIAALAHRNAIELSDQHFDVDVDRLIAVIDRTLPSAGPSKNRRLAGAGAVALVVIAAAVWLMRPGGAPVSTQPEPATHSDATARVAAAPLPAAQAAAPTGAPSWEQIRALPVLYAETFDPATILEVWKPQ